MRTLGWSAPFPDHTWCDIAGRLHDLLDGRPAYEPVLDIVDSVIAFGVEPYLAGLTSMTDLIVTTRPIVPPPLEVVIMRHMLGSVGIEHVTHTARNDKIERPADEAVGLFWRFVIEKFGIHPTSTGADPRQT